MSREGVLQITVSDSERAFVEARAKAEGSSVSRWLSRRVFGAGLVLSRAIQCKNILAAYTSVKEFEREFSSVDDWRWNLLMLRTHQSLESVICEVFAPDMSPSGLHDISPETCFIVAGSPWPYKILENYSWQELGGVRHTVLRLEAMREVNLWAPGAPAAQMLEG